MDLPNTTLYFRSGSSDKVYQIRIEASGGGYTVPFAYGRRGATMQTGNKCNSPVSLSSAQRIYDEVVSEKTGKGYSPGTAGTPFSAPVSPGGSTPRKPVEQYVPQLLNMVTEEEAMALLLDARYAAQEKKDGERMVLVKKGSTVTAYNKKGQPKGLSDAIIAVAKKITADFAIDGEAIGDEYYTFDLLELDGRVLRAEAFEERYSILVGSGKFTKFRIVEAAFSRVEKQALFTRLQTEKREGIVFKKTASLYVAGRPASGGDQVKFKFYATASFRVAAVNTKRSISVELLDTSHVSGIDAIISGTGGTWVNVGNVTIPPSAEIPKAGDIIEARYLYAYRGGSIFQSVYIGPRNDVTADEALVTQLKYKSDDE